MGNLLLDASSPAIVWNGSDGTVISGSFSPPAGSLLVAAWSGNNGSGNSPAAPFINSTGVTWTLIEHSVRPDIPTTDGQAAMWWGIAPNSSARTVAVTNDDIATGGGIKIWVWTDDGGGTPSIGADKENGRNTAGTSISDSVTATATGSRGVMVYTDWTAAAGTPSAGTGCTLTGGGAANQATLSYAFLLRSTADGVAAASITMNLTTPSTTTNRWVIAEVKPAAGAAAPAVGNPPIMWWPGDGPGMTERFTPDPVSQDFPPIAEGLAEQATHDHVTGDTGPSIADTDDTAPAVAHNTDNVTATSTTAAGDNANAHTTHDATSLVAAPDSTAPANTHTAYDATVSTLTAVNASAGDAANAHTTHDVTATATTTDTTAPANAHTANAPTASLGAPTTAATHTHDAGAPTPSTSLSDVAAPALAHVASQPTTTLSVNDVTAPSIGHTTHDATVSTAADVNTNAGTADNQHITGDVTATQTTAAGTASTSHVAPDATAALSLPAGTTTHTHSTGDALGSTGAPAGTNVHAHDTGQPAPAMSVVAIDAQTSHAAFDADVSTSLAVDVNAGTASNAHATFDATTANSLTVYAEYAPHDHRTLAPEGGITQSFFAGDAADTHQAQQAVAGVGKAAQDAVHALSAFGVGSTQTTTPGPATIALVAYNPTVTTLDYVPAFVGIEASTSWANNLDPSRATVSGTDQLTTVGAIADSAGSARHQESTSVPSGIVG